MAGTPLREILASFGIDLDTTQLREGAESIAGAIEAVTSLGRAVAATALVNGVRTFVQSMIDTGSELHDTSAAMGLSATELAGWRHAAGMAGVDAGALSGALSRVAVIARTHEGTFRAMGVTTRDAAGNLRSASDLLGDVGVAIGSIENETERTAAAVRIFGRSGRALIPLFADGADSVNAMREEVRQLYGTDLERLAEVSDEAGDSEDRLALRFDALRTRLAISVLPALTEGIDTLVEWSTSVVEVARNSRVMEAAVIVLGAAAAAAALLTITTWGPPVAIFLLVAAAIGLVVLAVDDFLVFLAGGDSVIGSFIDQVFGIGTSVQVAAGILGTMNLALVQMEVALAVVRAALTAAFGPEIAEQLTTLSGLVDTFLGGIRQVATMAHVASDALRMLGGASEEEIRAGWGTAVATAPSAGAGMVGGSRSLTTGPIIVNGTSDPVETSRRTADAIEDRWGSMASDAASDLVPSFEGSNR